MAFKDLTLQHSYSSENDDLLHDFYLPVLKEATTYRRITGYFSSSSFAAAADGMACLIGQNRGRLQYIINVQLSAKDYEAINQGLANPEEIIANRFLADLGSLSDACVSDHARVLGWLIASGILEIRVGYVEEERIGHVAEKGVGYIAGTSSLSPILHQKVGIFTDGEGTVISFSGSNNESARGWIYNSEKFKVFMSWEPSSAPYIQRDVEDFENLWNNRSPKTKVIPFPEAVKAHLIERAPCNEEDFKTTLESLRKHRLKKGIELREYQNDAIRAWFDKGGQGIFEMATGTGKTFTAIGALQELLGREKRLIAVISCPFLHLCTQWEHSLKKMGVDLPILFASSLDSKWKDKVYDKILDNRLGRAPQFIILTTHDTASSQKFIELLGEARSPLMLIGDEVHGMGSTTHLEALQPMYRYRLGLSATPERYFDEIGSDKLKDFFHGVVYEFNLNRAINEINPDTGESYLVPYDYFPIFVELTDEEYERYQEISVTIARILGKKNRTKTDERSLEQKMRERADIIKNCTTKFPAFGKLLHELKETDALLHTLIYCSPQQIDIVQGMITEEGGIIQHKFTFEEDAVRKQPKYGNMTQREHLLDFFDKGVYHVLVAIRCLDEGVDVPSTQHAILMCSSGNPKEYIQRRGRVLRRYPGKEKATIYDITALPSYVLSPDSTESIRNMVKTQLARLEEFAVDAMNEFEVKTMIYKVRERYGI